MRRSGDVNPKLTRTGRAHDGECADSRADGGEYVADSSEYADNCSYRRSLRGHAVRPHGGAD